jgi:hypothetical protein
MLPPVVATCMRGRPLGCHLAAYPQPIAWACVAYCDLAGTQFGVIISRHILWLHNELGGKQLAFSRVVPPWGDRDHLMI